MAIFISHHIKPEISIPARRHLGPRADVGRGLCGRMGIAISLYFNHIVRKFQINTYLTMQVRYGSPLNIYRICRGGVVKRHPYYTSSLYSSTASIIIIYENKHIVTKYVINYSIIYMHNTCFKLLL